MATLEHDHSRLNVLRWDHALDKPHTRLLCHKCNAANSKRDMALVKKLLHPWHWLLHVMQTTAGRRVIIRIILQNQITDLEVWFWEGT
jgi:hypothetical protein